MSFLSCYKVLDTKIIENNEKDILVHYWLEGWITGLSTIGTCEHIYGLRGKETLLKVRRPKPQLSYLKVA